MGDLIVPIADHPTGLWMRKTVDDCFASEVISPRTKLFMMGIVAKGLNCGYSAAASFRELGEKAPSRAEFNDILDSFGVGILPEGRAPVRENTEILSAGDEPIGKVTSGGFGPSAGGPVAMGYVDAAHAKAGNAVGLMLRGKKVPASIVKLPFTAHRYHKD